MTKYFSSALKVKFKLLRSCLCQAPSALLISLSLLLSYSVHAQTAYTTNRDLTVEERTFFINALDNALKVLNDEKPLSEQDASFGKYHHIEPKAGRLNRMYYVSDLASISFYRNFKSGWIWNNATIGLKVGDLSVVNLTQKDIDSLNLVLDEIIPSTYPSMRTPTGVKLKDIADLPCYNYQYRLKTNPEIRVVFRVYPEMMNKKEQFPRNFKIVNIYKDKTS